MKTITKEYEVYTFEELCDKSKESVKEWYLECREPDFFTEDCEEYLRELFPNSEIKVEYPLGYCQGDYFTISGEIYFDELLKNISDYFTEKEIKFLMWVLDWSRMSLVIHSNYRGYCNYKTELDDCIGQIVDDLEYECMRGIRVDLLERFGEVAAEYLDDLCGKLKDDGYDYFYEISDDDLAEECAANEWVFTADGAIFA